MGERKVLNKYYPPDFDPAKIPKRKELKNLQMKVRMMLPMSICCNTCGQYMYKGTKFNCRKEDVVGDTYLGLMKFRFYFKCTKCSAELVMKTDPQNSDYEMEFGASRNFEPWREADEVKDAAKKQREEEEMGDAMKALENRTMDSKMEMDILAGLDEVKSLRARQAKIDQDSLLEALKRSVAQEHAPQQKSEQELEEEDEKLIKSIVFRNSQKFVKRIEDDEDDEDEDDEDKDEEEGDETSRRPASEQPRGVLKAVEGDGPTFTLSTRATGKKYVPKQEDDRLRQKRRKTADASDRNSVVAGNSAGLGTGQSSMAKIAKEAVGVKLEDKRPVFEVKPVKVEFAVRERKRAARVERSMQAEGSNKDVKPQVSAVDPKPDCLVAEKSLPAAPEGLSLLSANYDDSDEASE